MHTGKNRKKQRCGEIPRLFTFLTEKPTKKRQKYIHIGKCVNEGSIYRIKCAAQMKAIKINSAYIGEM